MKSNEKQPKAAGIMTVLFLLFCMFQPNETASDGFFISWVITLLMFGGLVLYLRIAEDKDEENENI